eukprot:2473705-Rhodomonas_salina.1
MGHGDSVHCVLATAERAGAGAGWMPGRGIAEVSAGAGVREHEGAVLLAPVALGRMWWHVRGGWVYRWGACRWQGSPARQPLVLAPGQSE